MKEINNNVFYVGSEDYDRKTFDELIPLTKGTSYNSYLIKSDKNALIDTVDPDFFDELKEKIKGIRIDFIICNHCEQDHSGSIPFVLSMNPECKVVISRIGADILKSLFDISDNRIIIVGDDDKISLGDKTLRFVMTPWVHWPETMSTYLVEDKILFSCDLFGSHIASADKDARSHPDVLTYSKKYYAEIMMPFRKKTRKNIEKVSKLEIAMIAPSHGPIFSEPGQIIESYMGWTGEETEKKVLIGYVSMHGSTKRMAESLKDKLSGYGIETHMIHLSELDRIAEHIVDAKAIVLATPCFLAGAHPLANNTVMLLNMLKPKAKYLSLIGSYGWAPTMIEKLKKLNTLDAEIIAPIVSSKGMCDENTYNELDTLAKNIAGKID